MFLYNIWGFFRQAFIRIGIAFEELLYAITKGKMPKSLFPYKVGATKQNTNVKIVWKGDYYTDIAKFDSNGNITDEDFLILSSSDFHLDEDPTPNIKTLKMFVKQIKDNKPDLVVLTGDIIVTKYQQIDTIKFARMMEKLGIYWTIVFGNHEVREEKGFYKWLMLKSFKDYKHCLCKFGPDELYGYGNYTVNILGKDGKLRNTLFFFDSGRNIRDRLRKEYNISENLQGYDFLKKEQIDFYKNEIDTLENKYGKFTSLMYMHIPLIEYNHFFVGDEKNGYSPNPEANLLYGRQFESIGSSPYNSGMFDAIVEKGSTKAVFAGHDHINDWCGEYKGVYLVYNQHGGYSEYHYGTRFDVTENEWMQGVTLTTLYADGSLEIRQSLNSKYLNGGNNNE